MHEQVHGHAHTHMRTRPSSSHVLVRLVFMEDRAPWSSAGGALPIFSRERTGDNRTRLQAPQKEAFRVLPGTLRWGFMPCVEGPTENLIEAGKRLEESNSRLQGAPFLSPHAGLLDETLHGLGQEADRLSPTVPSALGAPMRSRKHPEVRASPARSVARSQHGLDPRSIPGMTFRHSPSPRSV